MTRSAPRRRARATSSSPVPPSLKVIVNGEETLPWPSSAEATALRGTDAMTSSVSFMPMAETPDGRYHSVAIV